MPPADSWVLTNNTNSDVFIIHLLYANAYNLLKEEWIFAWLPPCEKENDFFFIGNYVPCT